LEKVLIKRSHIAEDLDNLELEGKQLEKTLSGLSKINGWFGNTSQTLKAVQVQFQKHEIKTIVDLGCGGGDNLIAIAKWCQSQNKKVKLIGIDGNQNSLEYARSRSDFEIDFIEADILSQNFELPECDLLISSHFVYHFQDVELIEFLKGAKTSVRKAILFSELERSQIAFYLFWVFGFFFDKMVRSDGLKAIQRSFTKGELSNLLRKSGFTKYSVKNRLIFRLFTVIEISE
jgi:ubiquinone/menaquinone biosynthesis C-methylase UbiE